MKKILFVLFFLPFFAQAQLVGRAVSIADGDTFTMLVEGNRQIKIRLHGIDCPEKAQDFGQVAKTFLSNLIYNKTVRVKITDIDRYGRTIGLVMIDSINVNEELLKAGLAWHYKRYDKNPKWASLEVEARHSRKGLWLKTSPISPWEWRAAGEL
jgi:micrococcal nuclease